jgi:endonuclease/exonuclease/phosphatase family metal-dependent hydrolase
MPEAGAKPGHLRVLTWNIHGCVGADGRHDVARIARWVRRLSPDVAAFQEVDSRRPDHARGKVYDVLREEVGEHGHDAWAISGADGHYGQILASRFPLENKRVHDISLPGREPRKVMEARLRLPKSPLRVIATHLGLTPAERRFQRDALKQIVEADLSCPVVLLGDLNEWFLPAWSQRRIAALFPGRSSAASFPARCPLFALDNVWCRPGKLLRDSRAVRAARRASDHLPVLAELDLPVPR